MLYIDLNNHKSYENKESMYIELDEVEYAACKEIILGKKLVTTPYRYSRDILLIETREDVGSVCIALTKESIKMARACELIKFRGPNKTITVNISENDAIIKKAVLNIAEN